jgi:hypothetical protein
MVKPIKEVCKTVILQDCKFIHDEWGSSAEIQQRQLEEITYFTALTRKLNCPI